MIITEVQVQRDKWYKNFTDTKPTDMAHVPDIPITTVNTTDHAVALLACVLVCVRVCSAGTHMCWCVYWYMRVLVGNPLTSGSRVVISHPEASCMGGSTW